MGALWALITPPPVYCFKVGFCFRFVLDIQERKKKFGCWFVPRFVLFLCQFVCRICWIFVCSLQSHMYMLFQMAVHIVFYPLGTWFMFNFQNVLLFWPYCIITWIRRMHLNSWHTCQISHVQTLHVISYSVAFSQVLTQTSLCSFPQ